MEKASSARAALSGQLCAGCPCMLVPLHGCKQCPCSCLRRTILPGSSCWWPLQSRLADQVVATGERRHLYIFDLAAARAERVVRPVLSKGGRSACFPGLASGHGHPRGLSG